LADSAQRASLGAAAREEASGRSWSQAAESVRNHYLETIAAHAAQSRESRKRHFLAPAMMGSLVLAFRSIAAMRREKPTAMQVEPSGNYQAPVDTVRPSEHTELAV